MLISFRTGVNKGHDLRACSAARSHECSFHELLCHPFPVESPAAYTHENRVFGGKMNAVYRAQRYGTPPICKSLPGCSQLLPCFGQRTQMILSRASLIRSWFLFKEAQKCQVWDAVMLWHPSMKTAPAAGALYKLSRLKSVALACKIPCAVSSPIEHALQGIQ